jgi:hypothetical protein
MAIAIVAVGCKGEPEPLAVRKVLVDVAPGAEGPEGVLEREKVRSLVQAAIDRDKRMSRTEERSGAVLRVRLEAAALTAGDEASGPGGTLSVAVDVSGGEPGKAGRFRYRGHSVASLAGRKGASPTIDFPTLFRQAFADSMEQVMGARGAEKQSSDTLLAWLEGEEVSTGQRRQAIRVLGARKEERAVPALVTMLSGKDRDLSQAALGALTLIADPAAVEAVILYSEGKPSLVRKQAIEAVRLMGTRTGKAWLFTLSTGHPDADVRGAADHALAQLEQREPEPERTRVAEKAGEAPEAEKTQ